mmetsp:Transcript_41771/g.116477  ORF Transcript_41771/g.116477 Transcript_41771/m.116477 type:complete len:81 (+) Transcript_41771:893-1135(+)
MVMPLHAACHQLSYEEAVLNCIRAGGCNASRASIAGALIAAAAGHEAIPAEWLALAPRAAEVQRLAVELVAHRPPAAPSL